MSVAGGVPAASTDALLTLSNPTPTEAMAAVASGNGEDLGLVTRRDYYGKSAVQAPGNEVLPQFSNA